MSGAIFTVDLEDYYHAVTPPCTWESYRWRLPETWAWLLRELSKRRIVGRFYVLGWLADHAGNYVDDLLSAGHRIGSHGYYHQRGERYRDGSDARTRQAICMMSYRWNRPMNTNHIPYRSPYWASTPRPNFAGGFFFRALPYAWVKREVERTGVFYIHPHDLDPGHPRQPWVPWRRFVGLRTAREKLVRLLDEVRWDDA